MDDKLEVIENNLEAVGRALHRMTNNAEIAYRLMHDIAEVEGLYIGKPVEGRMPADRKWILDTIGWCSFALASGDWAVHQELCAQIKEMNKAPDTNAT